jgi:hypothetical protein
MAMWILIFWDKSLQKVLKLEHHKVEFLGSLLIMLLTKELMDNKNLINRLIMDLDYWLVQFCRNSLPKEVSIALQSLFDYYNSLMMQLRFYFHL